MPVCYYLCTISAFKLDHVKDLKLFASNVCKDLNSCGKKVSLHPMKSVWCLRWGWLSALCGVRLDNDPSMHAIISWWSFSPKREAKHMEACAREEKCCLHPPQASGGSKQQREEAHSERGIGWSSVGEKGKMCKKYNNKYEMFSSKTLLSALLALAGLPTQVR